MPYLRVLLPILAFFAASAHAVEPIAIKTLAPGETSPPASIEDLEWIIGYWEGEGLGGEASEMIAPPADGQMMGAFYHRKDAGDLNFYEFYVFAETGQTLTLRIKHFTPDFIGWEKQDEYVEFPLVEIAENAVYFDGLTFALTGPDQMRSGVNIENRGPGYFSFERKPLK